MVIVHEYGHVTAQWLFMVPMLEAQIGDGYIAEA